MTSTYKAAEVDFRLEAARALTRDAIMARYGVTAERASRGGVFDAVSRALPATRAEAERLVGWAPCRPV